MPETDLVRSELRQHVDAVRAAGVRAVGSMLDVGRELSTLKGACLHGEWTGALAATGIPERTSQRLMRAWREHSAHGTLDNPMSVTALLEAARDVKTDTLSDLDDTMLDPDQLFEQVDIFRQFGKDMYTNDEVPSDQKLSYACWRLKAGLDLKTGVESQIDMYTNALCDFLESYREGKRDNDECAAVEVLHMAVLTAMQRFYKKAGEAMGVLIAAGGSEPREGYMEQLVP